MGKMNYYFVLVGDGGHIKDTPLIEQEMEIAFRPVLGQIVEFHCKQYKVNRCDPSSNPDNQAVTYYLEIFNPDYPYRMKKKGASHGGYGGIEFRNR